MRAIVRTMASGASNPDPTPLTRGYAAVIRSAMARQTPPMTQTELAQLAGRSDSTISRMLSGKRSIATEDVQAICGALRLDLLDVTREAMAIAAEESRQSTLDDSARKPSRTSAAHSRPEHALSRSRVSGASRTRRNHS